MKTFVLTIARTRLETATVMIEAESEEVADSIVRSTRGKILEDTFGFNVDNLEWESSPEPNDDVAAIHFEELQ